MTRTITHITAGTEDWNPTQAELKELEEAFKRKDVHATRHGVSVQLVEVADEGIDLSFEVANQTLLSNYTHFNNGGITLSVNEKVTEYSPIHTLNISLSNMGIESTFSVPLMSSMAQTFEYLAAICRQRVQDPQYLSPVYSEFDCEPLNIKEYLNGQGVVESPYGGEASCDNDASNTLQFDESDDKEAAVEPLTIHTHGNLKAERAAVMSPAHAMPYGTGSQGIQSHQFFAVHAHEGKDLPAGAHPVNAEPELPEGFLPVDLLKAKEDLRIVKALANSSAIYSGVLVGPDDLGKTKIAVAQANSLGITLARGPRCFRAQLHIKTDRFSFEDLTVWGAVQGVIELAFSGLFGDLNPLG